MPGKRETGDKSPWMALLVFSEANFGNEGFPKVEPLKVGELIKKVKVGQPIEADEIAGPKIRELAAYENEDDLCNTIELEMDLFQKVAP